MADRELLHEVERMIRASLESPATAAPKEACPAGEAPDFARYLSGDMTEAEQAEAERHMDGCTACLANLGRAAIGMESEESAPRRIDQDANSIPSGLKLGYRAQVDSSAGEPIPDGRDDGEPILKPDRKGSGSRKNRS